MSIYRVRKKEDFEMLDQWVKRGMLGGSAKKMIGNAEALLEGRWTVAEIKSYISAAKILYQARGGIEAKVMQDAIKWMKYHQNPDPDPDPDTMPKNEWFTWDKHMKHYQNTVNQHNSQQPHANRIEVNRTVRLGGPASVDYVDLVHSDNDSDHNDGDNDDIGNIKEEEDGTRGPMANARGQHSPNVQRQDNAVQQQTISVPPTAAAQPRSRRDRESGERLQQVEPDHTNNQQASHALYRSKRNSAFETLLSKRPNEAAAVQSVNKKARSEIRALSTEVVHRFKPSETTRLAVAPRSAQGNKPTEAIKPAVGPSPVQWNKPTDTIRPAQGNKPTEAIRPAQGNKPNVTIRLAVGPRSVQGNKPAEVARPALTPKPAQGIERGRGTNNHPTPNTAVSKPVTQPSTVESWRQRLNMQTPSQTAAATQPTREQEGNTKIAMKDLPSFKKSNTPRDLNPGLAVFAERRGFSASHTVNNHTDTTFRANATTLQQSQEKSSATSANYRAPRASMDWSNGRGNAEYGNFNRYDSNRQHPDQGRQGQQAIPAQNMSQWQRGRSRSPRTPPRGPRNFFYH